jgi:uncharacterized protein YkwD
VPQHRLPPAHPRLREGVGVAIVLLTAMAAAIGLFLYLRPHPTHATTDASFDRTPSSVSTSESTSQGTPSSSTSAPHRHTTPSTAPSATHPGVPPAAPPRSKRYSHPRTSSSSASPKVESRSTSRSSSSSSSSAAAAAFADQVVTLTNQQRAAAGCGPLNSNPNLTTAAQGHSADMAANHYFDHDSQNGDTPWDRMNAAGYTGWTLAGENIAEGQTTPQDVMDAWMHSEGHRANILNCAFNDIGVGYAVSDNGDRYWTQDFGQRT